MITPRSLAAALFASATILGTAVPIAQAVQADPVPEPLVGPLAVEKKYQDLDKLQDVVLGPMALEPAKGNLQTYIKVTTAGSCPRGTNLVTRIYGPKLPEAGQNVIGNTYLYDYKVPPAEQIVTPLTITLAEVVERQPTPVTLDGVYRIWLQCQNADMDDFSINFGVFEGKLRIKDGEYTALTTMADLPKNPTPKTGPEGFSELEAMRNAPPPPTPIVDPAALAAAQQAASSAEQESGSDGVLAVAVVAGIIVIGLVPLVLFRRRTGLKAR